MQPAPSPAAARAASDGYSDAIRASWIEFFGTLPFSAAILDVGLGNHVPALLAAELSASAGRDWRIQALDPQGRNEDAKARAGAALSGRIGFHEGATPARLPFDDGSFDAVCGHHVIEFSDAVPALAEFHRVLKPGGDAQFVLHHADSALLHGARMSLREADLVFMRTKAFRRVHRLVTMGEIVPGSTQRATDDVRIAIRTLKRGLQVAQSQGGGRVLAVALDAIQKLLAARRESKPDAAGLAVDRAEAELRSSVRRLGDLVAHARSEADMRQLERDAAAAGFTRIERMALTHADNTEPLAWQLLMHRP